MAKPSDLAQAAAAQTHTSFFRDWGTRLSQLKEKGYDTQKLTPVIQSDWQKILAGGSPMTGQEAGLAALSVAKGSGILPQATHHHGLFDLLGNIPKDIWGVTRGATQQLVVQPIGAALQLAEGHPGQAWDTLKKGWDPETAAAVGLEAAAKVADVAAGATGIGAAAIPFIEGAAGAGSAALLAHQGVKSLQQGGMNQLIEHPVGTLLSFTPAAGELASGAAGLAARGGMVDPKIVEGKMAGIEQAKAAARAPADDLTHAESAYQAAAAGRPVKALYRTLAPTVAQDYIGGRVEGLMRRIKADPFTRDLNRATGQEKRVQTQAYEKLTHNVKAFLSSKGPEADARLFEIVTRPDLHPLDSLSPEERAVVNHIREFTKGLAEKGVEGGKLYPLTIGDQTVHYATTGAEGRVVEAWKTVEAAQKRLKAARERFGGEHTALEAERARRQARVGEARARMEEVVRKERGRMEERIAKARDRMEAAAQHQGYNRRFVNATEVLAREKATLAKLDEWVQLHPAARDLRQAEASLADVHNRVGHQKAAAAYEGAKKRAVTAQEVFDQRLTSTAPTSYHPMLENELRSRAEAKVRRLADGGQITTAAMEAGLKEMEQGYYGSYFSKSEWAALRKDVQANWLHLVKAGFDPVWVHTVPTARFEHVFSTGVLSDRYFSPSQTRAKVFDVTPRYANVGMALTSAAAEYIHEASIEKVITDHLIPTTRTAAEVQAELAPRIEAEVTRTGLSPAVVRDKLIARDYVKLDPERYGITRARARTIGEGERYVPKHVDDAFRALAAPAKEAHVGARFLTRTTAMLRGSLFFEPRHISHVLLGGAFAMMLRGGPEEVMSATRAWRMVKSGEVPPEIPMGLNEITTDQLWNLAAGEKAGNILRRLSESKAGQGVKAGFDAVSHVEEFVANVERVMGYLGEEKRGLRAGHTAEHASELALEHVHKTFVDWDGLTPLERTVIRQYIPFYSFSKYVVRYLLTYPIDHPVRAAVLAHLAENEQKDWNTGLPQSWQNLLMLGPPDKNGNIAVSDVKSINPFRDAGNMFSVAGFLMGLHPAIKTGLQALGVNTMSMSPEMYPQMDFDPVTNRLVTQRPAMGFQIAEQYVPPLAGIDHFLGLTADIRRLKASGDQSAYRRQLFSSLGIPFVPYKVSASLELARGERARYTAAKTAVDTAVKGGDLTALESMPWVPTPSWLPVEQSFMPGATLAGLLRRIEEQVPGVAPRAVIPKRRTKR
jgi:hypothetical protein